MSHARAVPASCRPVAALAVLALGVLVAVPALAVQRVVRLFDESRGLTTSETSALAQDSLGFVWIGTIGGVYRFDGHEMRRWASDSLRHVTRFVTCGRAGDVVTGEYLEPLYALTPSGVRVVAGADGAAIRDWRHATFARDGALWVLREHALARRDTSGRWREWRVDSLGQAQRVFPARGAHIWLATEQALCDVAPDGRASRRLAEAHVRAVAARGDTAWAALSWRGVVWRWSASRANDARDASVLADFHGKRGADLVARGRSLWACIDAALVELRDGAVPDTIAPRPGVPVGRVLLVDHESSLWMGCLTGLLQFPEPETMTYNDEDGMPAPGHARFCSRTNEGTWVGTWQGMSLLQASTPPRVRVISTVDRWRAAPDAFGHVWTGGHTGLHDRAAGGDRVFACDLAGDTLLRISGYNARADGTLWLATSAGLYLTPRDGSAPQAVRAAPPACFGSRWRDVFVVDALEDAQRRLWVTDGEHLAWADADAVVRGASAAWRCDSLGNVENLSDLEAMPGGALWVGTGNGGVWNFDPRAGWSALPGSRTLGSQRAATISRSPRRGVWLSGPGILERVEADTSRPSLWRVLEALSVWEGVPHTTTGEVCEERDGTVWIAGLAGLTRVPPEARFTPRSAPAVRLVDVLVDGRRQAIDAPLRLPFRRNRVELHFAAMSFRDPSLLRYQSRLRAGTPWTDSHDPDFRFVDLAPGRYVAQVRASLDGQHWSASPTAVAFTVLSPWYLQWWAIALALLVIIAALGTAYRVRVAFLLRLERQRVRIAMDLHDEMGAGLGSIGILAGVAAGERVEESERQRLAARIAETAGELGGTLSDIVWSLREDTGTLGSLAARLTERGRRLFPDEHVEFATDLARTWPAATLPLELRRNLQLIATEALHNAARHAVAHRVELGLLPRAGGEWALWVEDDGRGLPEDALTRGGGHGLRNLAARAKSMGANIAWTRPAGGGTRVEVRFSLPRGGGA